jgi:hypothetical protein
MATQSLINPVADYGTIVCGERFVGRDREITRLEQRVLGSSFGNLAIMGLPRIGKSSLAWQTIMTKQEKLEQEKTIPLFFQVGSCETSSAFYRQLVSMAHDEMSVLCDDKRYENFSSQIIHNLKSSLTLAEITDCIQKYFKLVRRLGYKIIYVLDEFDSIQNIFTVADFQTLRELSTKPDTKICIVTCSRKTIQEIEAKNGAISNFYGTFSEIRLGMFSEEDMVQYWKRLSSIHNLTNQYKDIIENCVGRHPYLLDLLNDYCFRNELFDLNSIEDLDEIRVQLWHQFDTIQETLHNECLLDKAIQLVLGPTYDVNSLEMERLLKYQFIKRVDNEQKMQILGRLVGPSTEGYSYVCFSNYFTSYFDHKHWDSIEYWPLWTDTEKTIRRLIKSYITENYTSDWETEIEAKYGVGQEWLSQFNLLKSTRKKTLVSFPQASQNLIDYTFPRDMYNVFMSKAWNDWFGKVFPGQKKDWSFKFNFLSEVRNPMAHNNKEFISKEQIQKAIEYCNEITRIIGEWEAQQES